MDYEKIVCSKAMAVHIEVAKLKCLHHMETKCAKNEETKKVNILGRNDEENK